MTVYIALLRGINVGGKNIIKMVELKRVFEDIGLSEVQTYIQSGNVLFKSNEGEDSLRKTIEQKIQTVFGYSITVVLRTALELEGIISNFPFAEEEVSEAESSSAAECVYVSLLIHAPSQEKVESLKAYKTQNDDYSVAGRDVYLLFRHSIRNSKLANNLQKLDVPATVRNWKTICKLAALAKAMEV